MRHAAPPPGSDLRRKIVLMCAAGAAVLVAGVAAIFLFEPAPPPPPQDTKETSRPRPDSPDPGPATPAPVTAAEDDVDARRIYQRGESLEQSQPDRPDLAIAEYHDVCVKYPQTEWAAKALGRVHELNERLRTVFEAEFGGLVGDAKKLLDAGNFRGAMEFFRVYAASTKKEILKRRAEAEVARIDNEARRKFNATVEQARELAREGSYDRAATLFRQLEPLVPDAVRDAAQKEVAALESAREADRQARALREKNALDQKLLAAGPELLDACRQHRFADAIETLDGLPDSEGVRDEREAVSAAGAFWGAFLKALGARIGQDVSLALTEKKRAAGTLTGVSDAGFTIDGRSYGFNQLQDDELVLIAVGRGGLPESAGQSYADAAMYFFCRGKRELSRLYLATAREMGFPVDALERAWRGGAMNAAAPRGKK